MTGAGTETDPYIVDNWADFVTAISTTDAYVAFPEGGGVIDMNDVQPEGITSQIDVACKSVQGNGWEIKNIYVSNCYLFYRSGGTTDFYDFKLSDMYLKADNTGQVAAVGFGSASRISFHNSKLSGILAGLTSSSSYRAMIASGYQPGTTFDRCSLNFKCDGHCAPFVSSYGAHALKNSQLKLSGTCDAFTVYLDNSYLSGDIEMTGNLTVYANSTASVINANIKYPGTKYSTVYTGALSKSVLINTDLITSGDITSFNLNQVTTEQLTDAAYLSSIGFPIGVE